MLTLSATSAYSSNCSLKGVTFNSLSRPQIEAMESVGAKCIEKKQGAFEYGKQGYYIIDGKKTDAIDVAAADPYDMDGKKVTFYGYIGYSVTETPRHEVWGYRFDAYLDEGTVQQGYNRVYINSGDNEIPLLFVADQFKDTIEQAKSDRVKIYKTLTKAKGYQAAVKVTGEFRNFRNTGDLYVRGASIELIQIKP